MLVSLPRLYHPAHLELHARLNLTKEASHHLARVLRAQVQDIVILFNGSDLEYEAIITSIAKNQVIVEVVQKKLCQTESPLMLHLAQGIARGEKMDFIIQKAVELGVNKITPILTERCNVRLNKEREEKRLAHWRAIAISACEQSGRCQVPEIQASCALMEWLVKVNPGGGFVLSPHVKEKLPVNFICHSPLALLIGPEGGLTEQEIKLAEQHQFLPLNLGPRILRTETASIAALSILQFCFGDLS